VDVELAAPALVLFEWPRNGADRSAPDQCLTGFLLLAAHFPAGQPDTPTRDDLLLFNEHSGCIL